MEKSGLLLYVIIVWIRFLLFCCCPPREPRSAEAAVRRGQKLTLEYPHPPTPKGDKACSPWAGQAAWLKNWAHCSDFLYVCTKAHLSPIKLYSRSNFLITSLVTEHEAEKPLGWVHRPALYFHSDAILLNNCVTKYPKNACLLLLYNFPISNIFLKKFHFDWFPVPYEPKRCAGENERLRNICF